MTVINKTINSTSIAALATPPGKGGVSIIRISGILCEKISKKILKTSLSPREATYLPFYNHNNQIVDKGIAILFKAPNSFTGEDVLELQGHGGAVIMDMLLESVITCGAELAKPGEFSERAFHNNKLDLAQAEAIADLIESGTKEAALSAVRSLNGEFSKLVHELVEQVTYLRIYVEAAIDFPEEEIDFLKDIKIKEMSDNLTVSMSHLLAKAKQGSLLREGIKVVIAGKPNAGKSSLLNALAGKDAAIVTDVEGTTRDVLSEQINLDGLPLHIVDTAGLRKAKDKVEKIGIEKAILQIEQANLVLWVVDYNDEHSGSGYTKIEELFKEFTKKEIKIPPTLKLRNKVDLINLVTKQTENKTKNEQLVLNISAKEGTGIYELKKQLKDLVGYKTSESGVFMARRRHLTALTKAEDHIEAGLYQLKEFSAGELLAEELKLAQESLNEITGEFTPDDLLGRIFTSFCIGK